MLIQKIQVLHRVSQEVKGHGVLAASDRTMNWTQPGISVLA